MSDEKKSEYNDQFNDISIPHITDLKVNENSEDTVFTFDKLGPFIRRTENDNTTFLPVDCFRIYKTPPHTKSEVKDPNTSNIFFLNRNSEMYEPVFHNDRFTFVTPKNRPSNADFACDVHEGNLLKTDNRGIILISKEISEEDLNGFLNGTIHSRSAITPVNTEEYTFSELFLKNKVPAYQSGYEDTPPEI